MFNVSFFLSFNYSKNETPVFDCCRKKKKTYKVVYKERTSAVSTSKNRKEKSDKK